MINHGRKYFEFFTHRLLLFARSPKIAFCYAFMACENMSQTFQFQQNSRFSVFYIFSLELNDFENLKSRKIEKFRLFFCSLKILLKQTNFSNKFRPLSKE